MMSCTGRPSASCSHAQFPFGGSDNVMPNHFRKMFPQRFEEELVKEEWSSEILELFFSVCEFNLVPSSFPTWNCSWLGSGLILIYVCLILGWILRIMYLIWYCQNVGICKHIWSMSIDIHLYFLWAMISWISPAMKQVIHKHGSPWAIGSKPIPCFWHSLHLLCGEPLVFGCYFSSRLLGSYFYVTIQSERELRAVSDPSTWGKNRFRGSEGTGLGPGRWWDVPVIEGAPLWKLTWKSAGGKIHHFKMCWSTG